MKLTFQHTRRACYGSYTVSAVINNFMPLLFFMFQTEFGITMGQLSFLITLNFGVQMAVDFLGAGFADKAGYRTTIVTANAMSALGLIALGTLPLALPVYSGLLIATVLYAIGSGLLEVMVSPIVAALPSDGQAASMSFLHSFYCWGQMLTVLVTTLFFAVFGTGCWSLVSIGWAILPICTTLAFLKVPLNSLADKQKTLPVRKLFTVKIFWLFMVLMLCSGASELAMSQWASYFAEDSLGISKTTGDLLGPCLFAVTMGLSRVIYGKFANKLHLANYLMFSAALCAVSYAISALAPWSFLSLAGCALCGFSVGVMWPGVLSLAAVRCSRGGTALFALLALCGDIGCFAGPNTATLVANRFSVGDSSLRAGLLSCMIFPAVMIAVTMILKAIRNNTEHE